MPHEASRCPKCDGEMVHGFVIDFTHGGLTVGQWMAGQPQKSFWQGLKYDRDGFIPVGTFRCAACGFLESYARPEFAPE